MAKLPPFDAPFRQLLRYHMARLGLAGQTDLADLTVAYVAGLPELGLDGLKKQTIHNWLGPRERIPQDEMHLLTLAGALDLNKAQATQLLWSADKPGVDEWIAGVSGRTGRESAVRRQRRALLAPWTRAASHTLPQPLTSFIGRAAEVCELALLFTAGERLVTLIGPGGGGKTRLSLEVARMLLDTFAAGIVLVPLEEVDDPARVLPTIARGLGLPAADTETALRRLIDHLRDKALLLVLDNCEQVLAAGPHLAALLAATPRVAALATSREPLNVGGERAWQVYPLPLPEGEFDVERLRENPAVALFAARAQAANRHFAVTRQNALATAMLCARLDGLPLALELAAARARDHTPAELLTRFTSLDAASAGRLDSPLRHRSLRQTIDWSDRLLRPDLQRLFRRLAVFSGGWTLAAAQAVCAATADSLAALRDASLLQERPPSAGALRYALLGTIREYALEQLAGSGEESPYRERHFDWCLRLAEEAAPNLEHGADQIAWLGRLDADYANLRAACLWAIDHAPARGLRLAQALWPYWLLHGRATDGRELLAALLARTDEPTAARAWAEYGLGYLLVMHDLDAASTHLQAALDRSRRLADTDLIATILPVLIFAALMSHRRAALAPLLAEATTLLAERGDRRLGGMLALVRGYAAEQRGDLPEARTTLLHALEWSRDATFPLLRCMALSRLGLLRVFSDEIDQAERDFRELDSLAGQLGAERYQLLARYRLGLVAEARGTLATAQQVYREAHRAALAAGDQLVQALSLAGQGRIALRQGAPDEASARLQDGLALAVTMDDRRNRGEILRFLWLAYWQQGQRQAALTTLNEALGYWSDLGHGRILLDTIEQAAILVADADCHAQATVWFGAAAARRAATDGPQHRLPVDEPPHAAALATCRAALSPDTFATMWAQGHDLPLARVVADLQARLAKGFGGR